jgi:hypothetical protein
LVLFCPKTTQQYSWQIIDSVHRKMNPSTAQNQLFLGKAGDHKISSATVGGLLRCYDQESNAV